MHMSRQISLSIAVLLLSLALVGCAGKSATSISRNASTAQSIVDKATGTLTKYLDGEHKARLHTLLSKAKGVMIIPGMGSISFFFSLGGGNGVMMAKRGDGWAGPVFLSKAAGGIGMQAGVTEVSGLVLYMDEADVRYVLETGAILQGQARITFLDADYEGQPSPQFASTGDVIFVGDTTGLYAGIGISGGGLSNRLILNGAYHAIKDGSPEPILFGTLPVPDGAHELSDLLTQAAQGVDKTKEKDGTGVPSK